MKRLAAILAVCLIFAGCAPAAKPDPIPLEVVSTPSPQAPSSSVVEETDALPVDVDTMAMTDHEKIEGNFPSEHLWATEEQLAEYKAIMSSLKLGDIKKIVAVSAPSDNIISKEIPAEQAEDIINRCKALVPALFSQPENPATGGALDIYIETDARKMVLGFNGNWLTMSIDGREHYWIFDAQPCESATYDIWGIVNQIIEA